MRYIIFFIILFMCYSFSKHEKTTDSITPTYLLNPSDTCNVIDSTDWKNVDVYLMKRKLSPLWLDLKGEGFVDLDAGITNIEDIPEGTLNEMKMQEAKNGGCKLFIDMKDKWGGIIFPMRKANKVFFYWGVPK